MEKGIRGSRVVPLFDKERRNKIMRVIYTVYLLSYIYKYNFTYTTYTTLVLFVGLNIIEGRF